MNKLLFLNAVFYCLFLWCNNLAAQTQTKVHQSFNLDGLKNITIDISYPYDVEIWDGNTVLLETSIDLDNAPPNLVKMFLETGRYKVLQQLNTNEVKFNLQPISRREVLTSKGTCVENISMTFYIPKDVTTQTLGNFTKSSIK